MKFRNKAELFRYLYKMKNRIITSLKTALANRISSIKIDYDEVNNIGIISIVFNVYNPEFEIIETLEIQFNYHFNRNIIIAHKTSNLRGKIFLNDLNININEYHLIRPYMNEVILNELKQLTSIFKQTA